MKLEQLKKSTQRFIRETAKVSGMSPEKVLRIMAGKKYGKMATSHLVYAR